ncbi:FAD-dependent monooxygenase [Micromonospora sp. WMMD882]|uniref:FAD-dependent monooxygenase n=1 Tax=Micromonospora sp. WMMD882 TaxID=3015151 RepID=UPI00248AEFCD|nr:FAD-dependent monooxygenase [Micromonospora sp. WMMD882]WBB78524.1 FAD-dependent monooxygenase [Micromonospora sp. WMMD882]
MPTIGKRHRCPQEWTRSGRGSPRASSSKRRGHRSQSPPTALGCTDQALGPIAGATGQGGTPRTTGGGRRLCARYLVGCDGADSTVRELVGFGAGTDAPVPGWMAVLDLVDREKLRPGFHYPPNGGYAHPARPTSLSCILTVVSDSLGTKSAADKRCNPYVGGL